jgi:hypothetical protein
MHDPLTIKLILKLLPSLNQTSYCLTSLSTSKKQPRNKIFEKEGRNVIRGYDDGIFYLF